MIRVMSGQRAPRSAPPNPVLIGLVLVIAFVGHAVLMDALSPAQAAVSAPLTLSTEADEAHVSHRHQHGCEISLPAVLKDSDAPLRQSTTPVIPGHPVLVRLAGLLPTTATTQARSPAAQRALLQVFRI
jgi:hypothetical protein